MNRNDRSWNPWHGCHKCSEGCKNCYMFYLDSKRDRDGGEIHKNKTDADLPIKKDRQGNYKIKSGEFVRVCIAEGSRTIAAEKSPFWSKYPFVAWNT